MTNAVVARLSDAATVPRLFSAMCLNGIKQLESGAFMLNCLRCCMACL